MLIRAYKATAAAAALKLPEELLAKTFLSLSFSPPFFEEPALKTQWVCSAGSRQKYL